jgi:hypothetical protein
METLPTAQCAAPSRIVPRQTDIRKELKMDFWEQVARLLAEKWIHDADPYDDTFGGEDCSVDSLIEWAASTVEILNLK